MAELRANGICLRAIDYGEADKLITVYLLEYGKILIKARGVKKPKAKLAFATSPICLGEYIINERSGYHTLINCSLISSFMPLWTDLEKFYSATAAIELLDKFTREGQLNDDVAITVIDHLRELLDTKDTIMLHLQFLARFIVMSGYQLSFDNLIKEGVNISSMNWQCLERVLDGENSPIPRTRQVGIVRAITLYLSQLSDNKLNAATQCYQYYTTLIDYQTEQE